MKNIYIFFLKIAMVVGFVPLTKIEKGELVKNTFLNVYSCTISIGISLFELYDLFTSKGDMHRTLSACIVFSISSIFIRSVYAQRETWKKWSILFENTNNQLKFIMGENMELGSKFLWIFLAFILLLFMNRLSIRNERTDLKEYIMDITLFMILAAEYLATIFLMVMVRGLKMLNNYSKKLYIESRLQLNTVAKMNSIKAIYYRNIYRNFYDMSKYFNQLFGWLLTTTYLRLFFVIFSFCPILINLIVHEELEFSSFNAFFMSVLYRLVSSFQLYLFICFRNEYFYCMLSINKRDYW